MPATGDDPRSTAAAPAASGDREEFAVSHSLSVVLVEMTDAWFRIVPFATTVVPARALDGVAVREATRRSGAATCSFADLRLPGELTAAAAAEATSDAVTLVAWALSSCAIT